MLVYSKFNENCGYPIIMRIFSSIIMTNESMGKNLMNRQINDE